jgi:hypothetical protein
VKRRTAGPSRPAGILVPRRRGRRRARPARSLGPRRGALPSPSNVTRPDAASQSPAAGPGGRGPAPRRPRRHRSPRACGRRRGAETAPAPASESLAGRGGPAHALRRAHATALSRPRWPLRPGRQRRPGQPVAHTVTGVALRHRPVTSPAQYHLLGHTPDAAGGRQEGRRGTARRAGGP